MADVFANNATFTTTSTSGTSHPASGTTETWSVSALSAAWPALTGPQTMAIQDPNNQGEIIRITASTGATGTSITVTRGADNTTPVAHSTGATFVCVGVASAFNLLQPSSVAPYPSGDESGVTDYEHLGNYFTDNAGQGLEFQAGNYYIDAQLTIESPFIDGQGMQNTVIYLVGLFGESANGYAKPGLVFTSASSGVYADIFARDFQVVGPYGGQNVNDSYNDASTGGIEVQGKGLFQNVSINHCMDGLITNMPEGHFYMINVDANACFNGVRWYQYQGDHCYVDCDFTNNSFSGTYIDAACQIIETHTELRVHRGFAPVGIYQDAANTNRMFRDCNFETSKFEKVGNECIVYGNGSPTAHEGGWGGVTWNNPVSQGSATYQRTSGTPALTSTGYGLIIGALEDSNFITGHGTFSTISCNMGVQYQGQGRIYFENGAGNVTDPTITNTASHPAPQSSWMYLSGERPRGAYRPRRQGFIGWAFDPALSASATALSSGVLYLVQLAPETIAEINYVSFLLEAQGTGSGGWTSAENWIGLYDCGQTTPGTATLLESLDIDTLLGAATSNTEIAANITAVQGYPDGDLYAAILTNQNWGTTTPTWMRGAAISGAFNDIDTQLVPRFGTYGTGQSTLPGTVTISSIANAGQAWWAGIR